MTKRKDVWTRVVLAVFIVMLAGAYWGWQRFIAFADTPLSTQAAQIIVKRGDRMADLVQTLRQAGVMQGLPVAWMVLAYQTGAAGHLKAGDYALRPTMTARQLLEHIRQGRVIQYRFTIVEGWTMRQLREALNHASPLEHTLTAMTDRALLEAIDSNIAYLEGWFLPETYLYQRGMTDRDILRRAHRAMQQTLARVWARRATNLPFDRPEHALILASIVEKETGLAAERRQIAGVFVRRLQRGMRLQTDPTVIYGMGAGYGGTLRKQDLETDSPYNTYTRSGLPQTPIAMPGVDALEAAVHPAPGDTLYFVAKGDGSGGHQFSATLAAHNQAVTRRIQHLQKNRQNDASHPR